ncbi:thermonuclease family protein (plasmid) [Rhizobium sp. RCAM05350]|uniref:thermonuclease family protein n=1 Tax=Rhizobium sp. RCAM05350 TaxID=2895568 RepID=UPI002076B702|nr:thermonuclease family protein [Rhizobium sp. RCAM05350]URK89472.1 thermonuclease family protein [Rhizobium sp. RCAM05350]
MGEILKFKAVKQSARRIRPAEFAVVGLALAGGLAFGTYSLMPASAGGSDSSKQFNVCNGTVRVTCVVDGDTFWLDGTKIRVADIDAPEISEPKCAAERALGERAKLRLRVLLNAGAFDLMTFENRDEDKYGRKLRVIMRSGQSLGSQLVMEGLARTWTGSKRTMVLNRRQGIF